jgi:hypothetical protein
MMPQSVAENVLYVLERERRATGVDEWDESDPRCLLYNDACEALGETAAYKVLGEVGEPDRLVRLDDVLSILVEVGQPAAASILEEKLAR